MSIPEGYVQWRRFIYLGATEAAGSPSISRAPLGVLDFHALLGGGVFEHHGRRHHYGHYGQCPYKFWEAPKLVRNVRTSFGSLFFFNLKKKVLKTIKHLTNLVIIKKKVF